MMRSRRPHTKSRNGCMECKRRKVKCDEGRPCFNCSRYGINCSLAICTEMAEAALVQRGTTGVEAFPSNFRGFGSTGFMASSILGGFDLVSPSGAINTAQAATDEGAVGFRSIDIELMHHYCMSTADTMAFRADMQYAWRMLFPQEGFVHLFVLRGVLSLAAIHLAYLTPTRRSFFLDLAAEHQSIGLRTFREIIMSEVGSSESDLGEEVIDRHWRPLFCFGTLTIAHVCALPVRSPEGRLPDPLKNTMELFDVIRGIKAIMGNFFFKLGHSDLAPLATGVWVSSSEDEVTFPGRLAHSILPADTFEAIDSLETWLGTRFQQDTELNDQLKADYLTAASSLNLCARQVAAAGKNPEIGMIMIWPFLIPQPVMADMRASASRSLVLLAYWAVLFSLMDTRCWYVTGWGAVLFTKLELELEGACEDQLAWPRANIHRAC